MTGTWGGTPGRFVLMGHSSGGHLVSLLAADPSLAAGQGAAPWLATIALDAGAFDIVEIMGRGHADFFDQAFGANPGFWRKASPIHRLTSKPEPVLLVCSSLGARSCPQARAFSDKVIENGGRASVLPVKLRHMAIDNDLGLPGKYTDGVDDFLKSVGLP
jgi:acetyl esterase/lipase